MKKLALGIALIGMVNVSAAAPEDNRTKKCDCVLSEFVSTPHGKVAVIVGAVASLYLLREVIKGQMALRACKRMRPTLDKLVAKNKTYGKDGIGPVWSQVTGMLDNQKTGCTFLTYVNKGLSPVSKAAGIIARPFNKAAAQLYGHAMKLVPARG